MVIRVSLTLDPVDVDLLDRLAALEGSSRSEQVRVLLAHARPNLRQAVEMLEAAVTQRDEFLKVFGETAAAEFAELKPEIERIQNTLLGSMSRIEGALAAKSALDDPRSSNHGGQVSEDGDS